MQNTKRIKTKYRGVFYRMGTSVMAEPERVYYIRYRKDGRELEEKVGRRFQDSMTAEKAAMIRAECMEGKRPPRKEIRKLKGPNKQSKKTTRNKTLVEESDNEKLDKEKWLQFMESATDGFTLCDSKLNVIEVNKAAVGMFPPGTEKKDILGQKLPEIVPDADIRREVEGLAEIIKTGRPRFMGGLAGSPEFGENIHFNVKVFKVGDGLGIITTDITEQWKKERELKVQGADLNAKNRELEETNTALEVLLRKREKDKQELEEQVLLNVKQLVSPFLEKVMNSRLDNDQKSFLNVITSNLNNIISPFIRVLSDKHLGLTYTELQVANLVKHGKTTKEIGELLFTSPRTIQFHRLNIRKKLGLKENKTSLRSYLMTLG